MLVTCNVLAAIAFILWICRFLSSIFARNCEFSIFSCSKSTACSTSPISSFCLSCSLHFLKWLRKAAVLRRIFSRSVSYKVIDIWQLIWIVWLAENCYVQMTLLRFLAFMFSSSHSKFYLMWLIGWSVIWTNYVELWVVFLLLPQIWYNVCQNVDIPISMLNRCRDHLVWHKGRLFILHCVICFCCTHWPHRLASHRMLRVNESTLWPILYCCNGISDSENFFLQFPKIKWDGKFSFLFGILRWSLLFPIMREKVLLPCGVSTSPLSALLNQLKLQISTQSKLKCNDLVSSFLFTLRVYFWLYLSLRSDQKGSFEVPTILIRTEKVIVLGPSKKILYPLSFLFVLLLNFGTFLPELTHEFLAFPAWCECWPVRTRKNGVDF